MTRERVVIIGGDAAGMSAVSRIRKGRPDAEIVALERSPWTSYSACGIPYLVGGVVEGGVGRLVARSPDQHREQGTDVRTGHEATAIDLAAREVEVRPLDGDPYHLGFDQLLIATGGTPIRPDLPGIDLPFIHGVQNLDDAAHLLDHAEGLAERCQRVVVVGSGYIGLEMAEAFVERGCSAVVVEKAPQPMGTLDPEMGALVATAMVAHGLDLRCGVAVTGFEPETVLTDDGPIGADLVVLGIGVAPNAVLAAEAGLDLGVKGAVHVDDRQATSAPGVWAAGDCAESRHLVTGRPVHIPLGTYANKQGRVAGINIGGGHAVSAGILGTAITKLCATEIARTGLGEAEAERAGLSVVAARIETTTTSGYFPAAAPMTVKVVAERGTGRLLGAQIVGGDGAAKRIDTCAVAITAGMTVGPGGRPRPGLRAALLQRLGPDRRGCPRGPEAPLTRAGRPARPLAEGAGTLVGVAVLTARGRDQRLLGPRWALRPGAVGPDGCVAGRALRAGHGRCRDAHGAGRGGRLRTGRAGAGQRPRRPAPPRRQAAARDGDRDALVPGLGRQAEARPRRPRR